VARGFRVFSVHAAGIALAFVAAAVSGPPAFAEEGDGELSAQLAGLAAAHGVDLRGVRWLEREAARADPGGENLRARFVAPCFKATTTSWHARASAESGSSRC
jgi:hypothetical protein